MFFKKTKQIKSLTERVQKLDETVKLAVERDKGKDMRIHELEETLRHSMDVSNELSRDKETLEQRLVELGKNSELKQIDSDMAIYATTERADIVPQKIMSSVYTPCVRHYKNEEFIQKTLAYKIADLCLEKKLFRFIEYENELKAVLNVVPWEKLIEKQIVYCPKEVKNVKKRTVQKAKKE